MNSHPDKRQPQLRGTGPGREDWRVILSSGVTRSEEISTMAGIDVARIRSVTRRYPMRINAYYLSLIDSASGPLGRQAIPDSAELLDADDGRPDPLAETRAMSVPQMIHRYPDRVVLLASNQCAVYCRHCMRKRMVGRGAALSSGALDSAIDYVRSHPEIKDVILSGGDPLLLEDDRLGSILAPLRATAHVEIVRIHSRVPCVLPQRITPGLLKLLAGFHPLYINTQFNHPDELTPRAAEGCRSLADAGIPVGCQTVLLKGVNDDPSTMTALMRALVKCRVKPYYLHHPDPVAGTSHFRVSIKRGLQIMAALRGNISGLCVPHYMIDLPEGGGKIPLLPEYIQRMDSHRLWVKNFAGKIYSYPLQ